MRAPIRSHGFDKPSDLEDELSQLDDDVKATATKPSARAKPPQKPGIDASLHREIEDLRRDIDTIRKQVEERPNRIGIDTGAYRYGVLTALALEGSDRWYLQASDQRDEFISGRGNQPIQSVLDAVSSQSG